MCKRVMFFLLALVLAANSATISWQKDVFNDVSKIENGGTLLCAYNLGSQYNIRVNGVVFTAEYDLSLDDTYFKYSGNGAYASANYQPWYYYGGPIAGLSESDTTFLLGSFVQDSTYFAPDPDLMTIKNLTVGKIYQVQVLAVWNTAPNAAMLFDGNFSVDYTGWGVKAQLVTGTFTADSAVQTFRAGYQSGDYIFSNINAIQVREIFPLKNLYPANGADNGGEGFPVSNFTLSWESGGDPAVTGYFLYLDEERTRVESSTGVATSQAQYAVSLPFNVMGSYKPLPPLMADKTYYWRVDQRLQNDPNYVEGPVFSFVTKKTLPQIIEQPKNNHKLLGENATFNISAQSITACQYQWRKVKNGSDTALSGKNSTELVITNIDMDDFAAYYCVVQNSAGPVNSDTVWITIKDMIGQWKFDNDANPSTALDSSGYGNNASIVGASYNDDGNGGKALLFSGAEYVDVPVAAFGQNLGSRSQISLALWQYGDVTQPRQNVIFKGTNGDYFTPLQCELPWSDGGIYWAAGTAENESDFDQISVFAQSPDQYKGKWNQWFFTKNADTGKMAIYLNGMLLSEETGKFMNVGNIDMFTIGAAMSIYQGQTVLSFNYKGMIKDFRLYNYEVSAEDVAQMYYDETGIANCVNRSTFDVTGPDGEADCVVNLYDFAQMANQWMKCNMIPAIECPQ